MAKMPGGKAYECKVCSKTFAKSKKRYKDHLNTAAHRINASVIETVPGLVQDSSHEENQVFDSAVEQAAQADNSRQTRSASRGGMNGQKVTVGSVVVRIDRQPGKLRQKEAKKKKHAAQVLLLNQLKKASKQSEQARKRTQEDLFRRASAAAAAQGKELSWQSFQILINPPFFAKNEAANIATKRIKKSREHRLGIPHVRRKKRRNPNNSAFTRAQADAARFDIYQRQRLAYQNYREAMQTIRLAPPREVPLNDPVNSIPLEELRQKLANPKNQDEEPVVGFNYEAFPVYPGVQELPPLMRQRVIRQWSRRQYKRSVTHHPKLYNSRSWQAHCMERMRRDISHMTKQEIKRLYAQYLDQGRIRPFYQESESPQYIAPPPVIDLVAAAKKARLQLLDERVKFHTQKFQMEMAKRTKDTKLLKKIIKAKNFAIQLRMMQDAEDDRQPGPYVQDDSYYMDEQGIKIREQEGMKRRMQQLKNSHWYQEVLHDKADQLYDLFTALLEQNMPHKFDSFVEFEKANFQRYETRYPDLSPADRLKFLINEWQYENNVPTTNFWDRRWEFTR